jgi:N-acetyl-alpha-D-muramate 1-phosphate uridylyltransferase
MNLYPVVILAGGEATRLRPITEKIPKALVEVAGEPFISHQLRLLHFHGVQHVVISAWYRGHMIRDYVGDGSKFDMQVSYVFDGDKPLGTGGAIRRALPFLREPFFVLYGDSYLPCNYDDIQSRFESSGQPALMTVYRNVGKWDASNVEMADETIVKYDKTDRSPAMQFIDYGLGVFHPDVFQDLAEGEYKDLADAYRDLAQNKRLAAYIVQQRFYEIGSHEGLHELDEVLKKNPNHFLLEKKS